MSLTITTLLDGKRISIRTDTKNAHKPSLPHEVLCFGTIDTPDHIYEIS